MRVNAAPIVDGDDARAQTHLYRRQGVQDGIVPPVLIQPGA